MYRLCRVGLPLAMLMTSLGSDLAAAAEPPRLRELRMQRVGNTIYFHVGFQAPAELDIPVLGERWPIGLNERYELGRQPRLVPQDGKARAVYARVELRNLVPQAPANPAPPQPLPVTGLEFVGQCAGRGQARFLLCYPITRADKEKQKDRVAEVQRRDWVEIPVELDFDKAERVAGIDKASQREPQQPPKRDDLEGLWASGQAARFAVLEAIASESGFYRYAREATGRKYGVNAPSLLWRDRIGGARALNDHEHLYETTTGAAAITESLQTERMAVINFRDTGKRDIDIQKVAGIDIAEHPWKKMMGDQKPDPEPLARLVPQENYYLHFKNVRKLIELGELSEQWGTSLVRAFDVQSRDYDLRQRYERQLCLRSTVLGKTLGPLVIHGVAVTGSDAYLREGSDITVLFHVVNPGLFRAAVEPFIQAARKEWGGQLKEGKDDYQGVTIEHFTTPLREVSLHRATVGDYVIYGNSLEGVRRVIDTQQGRRPALADSLDFQYMRTVFRRGAPEEDGFLFLSDPFIRQLVGPARKIKEKRRLEALTSLAMTTHDVLFTAWENGTLPEPRQSPYSSAVLTPEMLYTPEGKGVTWDVERRLAVSDAYGTLRFATPLIELPIARITETEQQDYLRFRAQYLGLWRNYFDPIGMRFALNDRQVRIETYILPLVQSSEYNQLRQRTGDGTIPLEINGFAPQTVLQLMSHISPNAPERTMLSGFLQSANIPGGARVPNWLGDWFMFRMDDSPIYARLAQLAQSNAVEDVQSTIELYFQMPVTLGVGIKNPLVFAGVLTALRGAVFQAVPDAVTWEPLEPKYKNVNIVRIQAKPSGIIDQQLNRQGRKQPFLPAIFYAQVNDGWYISLREECIKAVIDRAEDRKAGKLPKPETVPVNTSLYLSLQAAEKTIDLVKFYLERQAHEQALVNAPIWYALYRTGVAPANASSDALRPTAINMLGYVPVSADGAAYVYDAKKDEVTNQRHGSPSRPRLQAATEGSPVARLLEQFRTLRADLRFREDGVQTVLTIERRGP